MHTRIPFNAVQKAIIALLSLGQTVPVYREYSENNPNLNLPYIALGQFTCKANGAKKIGIYDVTLELHVGSDYNEQLNLNLIVDDIATLVRRYRLDLSDEKFIVLEQGMEVFTTGANDQCHGIYKLGLKIQDRSDGNNGY